MAEKAKFLKGQLLLDSGQLGGSFFQRTVVLVCQHNNDGAFGLVLNRGKRQVGQVYSCQMLRRVRGEKIPGLHSNYSACSP